MGNLCVLQLYTKCGQRRVTFLQSVTTDKRISLHEVRSAIEELHPCVPSWKAKKVLFYDFSTSVSNFLL